MMNNTTARVSFHMGLTVFLLCLILIPTHTDALTGYDIDDGTIATRDLANGAVTADKLANGAVTAAKLANGAVTLPNNYVTKAMLANGSVGRDQLDTVTYQTILNSKNKITAAENEIAQLKLAIRELQKQLQSLTR